MLVDPREPREEGNYESLPCNKLSRTERTNENERGVGFYLLLQLFRMEHGFENAPVCVMSGDECMRA